MNDKELLIKEFAIDLEKLLKEIIKNVYTPKLFIGMVKELGHYEATKRTILKSNSTGYLTIMENGRPELLIENLVINPKYESLFSEEEIIFCKRKLGL